MQHRSVGRAILARRYLSEVRKWRTIKNNKFQRLMQHIPVKGAIWARRYLRKTQKLCFSLSIRYEARLARACPTYRDMLHQSVSCIIIVVLHYERLLSASMTLIQVYTAAEQATLFFTAFFFFSAKISTLSKIPNREGMRKITKKREHTAPLPINFPSWPMAGTEEIKEIT